jgi:hypothetical protein
MNVEDNKIIAEFMYGKNAVGHNQYDTSWSELMYAVKKLYDIGISGGVAEDLRNALRKGDIEETFNEVVIFIQWYNKHVSVQKIK